MKRILKWVGWIAGGASGRARAGGGAAYALLRNTVPSPSGTLAVAGLSAPVEVVRDREGVPHIFATHDDLFAALGFVHAQDRLWQMELPRRAGQGRLSEIFGERTFATDVFLRTLDLYGHAERALAALPPDDRGRSRPTPAASTPSSTRRPAPRAAAAAGVPAAAPPAGAVARSRQPGHRQDDGAEL